MTSLNTTKITRIDNRFSAVARQAAKSLGVDVGDVIQKAYATYDASRHYVEVYDVPAGGMIVLSANDELFQAAHVSDDFDISHDVYDERNAFDENAAAAGITRSSDLNDEYLIELEYERMFRRQAGY
ncbi:hypothetical protein [Paracoccus benzoatiresistens]|uniref:Uncharacterized protein n=1 Tax=Paracoccus benzoatiresistens TaxID=2997341 RepID=A0ABT4J5R3_9RHOB|nr:hypothetical protein [Paracoccus sp. EF6]MCZ0962466.1 hypothetical protein [Paracoccus sp. EF6]